MPVPFTQLPIEKQRDCILFVGLGKILEDEVGLTSEDVLTPEEETKLDELLQYSQESEEAAIELTRAMFREVVDRLLSEVPATDGEN